MRLLALVGALLVTLIVAPAARAGFLDLTAVTPGTGCNRASAKSFSPFPRVFARDLARVGHLGRRAA